MLYAETGTRPWILLFGPVLAVAGIGLESLAPGGVSVSLWLGVGLLVFLYTLVLVRSRRRFLRVELTPSVLVQGTTRLPMSQVTSLRPADEEHHGVRVLGDGPVVPRRLQPVVLRLSDGTRAVAWARDGAALRRALEDLLRTRAVS
ncbi:hypothetical protein GCM10023203_14590 [Actinomycetospora straminea]|uniref:DUF3093 family protein n=1 Tax=Actinomycetospora straminea TaxID=663607 RepID=A0ABP9E260_9PSEU